MEGIVFFCYLGEPLLAAEVPAKADLDEDEGAVLAVEGVGIRSGIGWHSLSEDDVRGGSHPCRRQVVEDPSQYVQGDRHAFFVIPRCLPLHGEGLCVYGHINSGISAENSLGGGPGGANHSALCGGGEG